MPPVNLTGDLGTGGRRMLDVVARNVANDGTMVVTFEYHFQPSVLPKHRIFNHVHIDTIEFAIVATYIDQERDGINLPVDAIVVAAGATQLPVDGPCELLSGRGSVMLPVHYFAEDAHRRWTVVLRSRGCRNENGDLGVSRVLSAEFRHASVSLQTVLDHGTIKALMDEAAEHRLNE